MANETLSSSFIGPNSTGIATSLAYELAYRDPFRAKLVHDQFATVRSTNQSHNGASVRFEFINDVGYTPGSPTSLLSAITTALTDEISDAPQEALLNTYVDVGMAEYGRVVATTAKLRGQAFIPVDPIAARKVGWTAGTVHDELARLALIATTNNYGVTGGNTDISSNMLRKASTILRKSAVEPFMDGNYMAILNPDQEYDLRLEADAAGWRYYQQNQNPMGGQAGSNGIQAGSIEGKYESFNIMVSPRVPVIAGAGATQEYGALVFGQEALAKAFSRAPGFGEYAQIVPGLPTDNLKRVLKIGYYWLGGYAILRAAAVAKLSSGSSLN